jgi:predicted nucleic acid-binding Zn ribbon protein
MLYGGTCVPVYVYKNLNTGETFEFEQRITEKALTHHPETSDPVKRLIQPVGIAFKGSGFYVTDSRNSSKGKSESKSESKPETKSESSESKPESKAESKTETKSESKSEAKKESKSSESKSSSAST